MGSASLLALVAKVQSFRRSNSSAATEAAGEPEVAAYVGSFHEDLGQRVGQLQLHGGSAHVNWLLDACACTLSTHVSLASALPMSVPPPNQRADEVLSMLDTCASLKQVADDVDRQLGLLQAALENAAQGCTKMGTRLAAARRLQTCLHGLETVSTAQQRAIAEAQAALFLAAKRVVASSHGAPQPLNDALDGTLLMSLLVLASALATFAPVCRSSSSSVIRAACKRIAAYTAGKSGRAGTSWAVPLRQLQRDLKQEQMSAIFLELQGLRSSASSLHAIVSSSKYSVQNAGEVKQKLDSLRKYSQEVQACVNALRAQLDALFQALLALRLCLLHGC